MLFSNHAERYWFGLVFSSCFVLRILLLGAFSSV
jgi:hypothetical protein